ncbi:MAG: MerR family transcriptional regulator [Pseudohongiellaceae bacterium]
MRVSELAGILDVTPDTVRYYTRVGILRPQRNKRNGYKEYTSRDLSRLRFVISARHLGFSVGDIEQIVSVADKGRTPCPLVRRLIEQRLHETQRQFADTGALRKRMTASIKQWRNLPDKEPNGSSICYLIEGFNSST